MPLVKVEIFKGETTEHKQAVLDGIHSALVKSFEIPEWDRMQRLYELDKANFEITPDKTTDYTLIQITMFKGRSLEAKKKLYSGIVENLEEDPGIAGDDITIVVHEPSLENWGIWGGQPASEVDLPFKVDV